MLYVQTEKRKRQCSYIQSMLSNLNVFFEALRIIFRNTGILFVFCFFRFHKADNFQLDFLI